MWLVATALYSTGLKAPYLVLPSGQEKELGSGRSLLGEKEGEPLISIIYRINLGQGTQMGVLTQYSQGGQ